MSTHSHQQGLDLPTAHPGEQVDAYTFAPIKGYPMLHWRGKRPFTGTQFYPAQLRETHGPEVNGWRNKLYWGDNLQVMSHLLKTYRGQVQLVYIDPPYDSKAEYKKKVAVRGKKFLSDHSMFEEKQYTDIWTNDEYLQFMYERLILIRELLADNGSIFLHCDRHKDHHLRCLLDDIFGNGGTNPISAGFRNEIVWSYESGGRSQKNYSSKHDIIYWYSKTAEWKFNMDAVSEKRGLTKKNNMKRTIDSDGRMYYSIRSSGKEYRYYEDDLVPPTDVWNISHLQQQDPERLNYPTQKPEKLLERIIVGNSDPGDIVFDCFMGSGTTQAVAMKLSRRFVGTDINLGAIQTTTRRLLQVATTLGSQHQPQLALAIDTDAESQTPTYYPGFEIYNVNQYDIFRNPIEAKDLLLQALEASRLPPGHLFDGEKDGRMIKVMPINRIATRQDLNDLLNGFDYKTFERRYTAQPTQPVEKLDLICMGHEPGLAAHLQREVPRYQLDVRVVDILREKQDLQFKRDAEARILVQDGDVVIERFYPMNLLSKLSWQHEQVGDDWRDLVESVMIDWNYDGAVLQPTVVDIPDKDTLVAGRYPIPVDAGTIRVKITDLLSESLEVEVAYG